MSIRQQEAQEKSNEPLKLVDMRHFAGLYSVEELSLMFKIRKAFIYHLISVNNLKVISPNGKSKFVYLEHFINYLKSVQRDQVLKKGEIKNE